MLPRWQVEELSASIVKNISSAEKIIMQLQPKEWLENGAPDVYVEQHQTLLDELEKLKLSAESLHRDPERLTYAIDTLLWLERTDVLLASLTAGVRRYYNGSIAKVLESIRNRNSGNITQTKLYFRQLAMHLENRLEVAHKEAQRCRNQLVQ